ncbi:MAG: oligosaccharide flippase family protein [Christensenellales bacterium]|jgi:stage V sporulation protein B
MKTNKKTFSANSVVKSTLLLSMGGLIAKFLGAFFRIPISNIIGAEGMGVYQLIFPLYAFFLVFISGGIPLALAKLVSRSLAEGKENKIKGYFFAALVFSLISGLVFALIFVFFAKQISAFQGIGEGFASYYAVGLALIFSCLISVFRGLFQGHNNMLPTFVSQIIQQGVKLGLGILFAVLFISKGLNVAVFFIFISIAISELLALVYYIVLTLIKQKQKAINTISVKHKQTQRLSQIHTKLCGLF